MNPITFSTLACPNWQIEPVIAKTSEFGYDGIEWRRGPQGHVQPDTPAAQKALLQQRCSGAGLGANYVRAFLGELPEGTNLDSSIYERISDCQCSDPLV